MYPESPRQRFLSNKDQASAHAAMMATRSFEEASDAAMLQTALNLLGSADINASAANEFRMQGARMFLWILMTIGDPEVAPPEKPDKGLNYEATKIK